MHALHHIGALHQLRALRRARNFDPLTALSLIQKAGRAAQVVEKLGQTPERLEQVGHAAQSFTDARVAERLGQTANELTETARWIKYVAIGGLELAGLVVVQRTLSPR